MTREQIREVIDGLERIARGECHSYSYKKAGSRSETARDALTLLRGMAETELTQHVWLDRTREVFGELDSDRKAASGG